MRLREWVWVPRTGDLRVEGKMSDDTFGNRVPYRSDVQTLTVEGFVS